MRWTRWGVIQFAFIGPVGLDGLTEAQAAQKLMAIMEARHQAHGAIAVSITSPGVAVGQRRVVAVPVPRSPPADRRGGVEWEKVRWAGTNGG